MRDTDGLRSCVTKELDVSGSTDPNAALMGLPRNDKFLDAIQHMHLEVNFTFSCCCCKLAVFLHAKITQGYGRSHDLLCTKCIKHSAMTCLTSVEYSKQTELPEQAV